MPSTVINVLNMAEAMALFIGLQEIFEILNFIYENIFNSIFKSVSQPCHFLYRKWYLCQN